MAVLLLTHKEIFPCLEAGSLPATFGIPRLMATSLQSLLCLFYCALPVVCLSPCGHLFIRTLVTLENGTAQSSKISSQLIISAKMLFPNKVTFWRHQGLGPQGIFLGSNTIKLSHNLYWKISNVKTRHTIGAPRRGLTEISALSMCCCQDVFRRLHLLKAEPVAYLPWCFHPITQPPIWCHQKHHLTFMKLNIKQECNAIESARVSSRIGQDIKT